MLQDSLLPKFSALLEASVRPYQDTFGDAGYWRSLELFANVDGLLTNVYPSRPFVWETFPDDFISSNGQ